MRRLFAAIVMALMCLSCAQALETDDYGFPIESAAQPSFSNRSVQFDSTAYRPSNSSRFIFRSTRTRQFRPVGIQQRYVIQSQPVAASQSPVASSPVSESVATPTTTATPLPAAKE